MKAELVPANGDPPIPITRDVTVIGRKDYCDIKIDHHSLSKRHCVIVRTDGLLIIRDLATTNGTKVKGQKIRWAALLPDDRITLGAYKMRVYLGPDDAPGPSELVRAGKPAFGAVRGESRPGAPTPPAPPKPAESPAVPLVVGSGDDLEIVDDAAEDSGWRKLIGSRPRDENEDLIIELE